VKWGESSLTNDFSVFIIKSLMEKSHGKKEYISAELSERGRLVGEPQKRGVEAVFSVCLYRHSFMVEM
jgi:hypothetical protein